MNITIAAASFRSASPSTRRVSRAAAPTSRNTAITAAGSVVATTEPSSRQTTSGKPAIGQSAKPTTAVQTIVATTASIRIGAASSSIRRTSTVIAPSKTSSGRKT